MFLCLWVEIGTPGENPNGHGESTQTSHHAHLIEPMKSLLTDQMVNQFVFFYWMVSTYFCLFVVVVVVVFL